MQISNPPIFGTAEQSNRLDVAIKAQKERGGSLINVLQEAQDIYGYLPIEVQKMVARGMKISVEEVYSTATFYQQFSFTPKGKYKISVCIGTACYVKGAGVMFEEFSKQLGIPDGGCTEDGLFSLDGCRCIGACGLAPVLTINEDVHGKIYQKDVAGVLAQYPKSTDKEGSNEQND